MPDTAVTNTCKLKLLVVANSPMASPLPDLEQEIADYEAMHALYDVTVARQVTARGFVDAVHRLRPHIVALLGHGDVALNQCHTPAFIADGAGDTLVVATPGDLAEALGACSTDAGGHLRVLLLNGCCTMDPLGKAAQHAGVEHVFCWNSRVYSTAARFFGPALLRAIGDVPLGDIELVQGALTRARVAFLEQTSVQGQTDAGISARVPLYALDVNPEGEP